MKTFFVSVLDAKYFAKNGHPLKKVQLKQLLEVCYDSMKDDKQKGKHGAIFPYINNMSGKEYWPNGVVYNDNVAFFDLDWISKECAEKIFECFEEMCGVFNSLLAIQYSSSHFMDGQKHGVHIYVHTRELDNTEFYNECRLIYMALLQTVHKVTGYDLREPQFYESVSDSKGQEEKEPCKIVDDANMEITQRIFLYYSPFKWNDSSEAFDDRTIEASLPRLEEKFGYLFKKKRAHFMPTVIDDDYKGCYDIGDYNGDKLCVDRHLCVAEWKGNDIRWRIASIGNNLFGEEASKAWCDKHFYYENGRSIWSSGNHGVNHRVLNWLIEKGYIKSTTKSEICYEGDGIEVKTFLKEEQYDYIKEMVAEHKVTTIIGDPGLGKTVCSGSLAKEMKGVVLTPFKFMRYLYEKTGLEIVDATNRDTFDFESNACTCTYDQLPKIKDKVAGKTIFLDESHILFKDRLYRNTLIYVMETLKSWNGKVVIVSATPLRETTMLRSEVELKFWKKRKIIEGCFKIVDSINKMKALEYNIVSRGLNSEKYTHICVFGNRGVRMAYDNLTLRCGREIHNKVNIFHRDYDSLGDIQRLQETELLDKKINLGTSLVFNGVNFKNEGANVLVVIEYVECDSNWCDIVQACTRIRKSNVTLYVIACKKADSERSLDDDIEDAKLLHEIGIDKNLICYSSNYVEHEDVVREIDSFMNEEGTIEHCLEKLKSIKWIDISTNEEEIDIDGHITNLLRAKIDEIIKKELNGIELDEKEKEAKKDGIEYYEATMRDIESVCVQYGIEYSDIIALNNSEKIDSENNCKTVTLATTLAHIRYNVIACYDDDGYWKAMEEIVLKKYEGSVMQKRRVSCIEDIKKTRALYRKYFENEEMAKTNGYGNVRAMIEKMVEDNEAKNEDKAKKRSAAGKKGTKKIKDIETGIVYDSMSDCAKAIGKSVAAICKNKKRFVCATD